MQTTYPFRISIFLALALLAGCAAAPSRGTAGETTLSETSAEDTGTYWWWIQFRFARGEGEGPQWFLDPLVAERVVAPVLVPQMSEVPLWRFHRRAVRDAAGHQFSLVLYAKEDTARTIYNALERAPLVTQLLARGMLREIRLEQRDGTVAGASDPAWSPALQRAWPYYIMGASVAWMELIKLHAPPDRDFMDLDRLLAAYREVNDAVSLAWRNQGQHAFIHHLNALFGYVPVQIRNEQVF